MNTPPHDWEFMSAGSEVGGFEPLRFKCLACGASLSAVRAAQRPRSFDDAPSPTEYEELDAVLAGRVPRDCGLEQVRLVTSE